MPSQKFSLNLDDATYQAALDRAQQAGKTLEQLMADFLVTYAEEASDSGPATYTVQRGDTLTKIARTVYGDPYKYPLIQQANNIDDAGRIWVGQVLVIPGLPGVTPSTPQPGSPATPKPQPETATPQPQPTVIPTPESTEPVEPAKPSIDPSIDPCQPIEGISYRTLSINGSPTDRPAPVHGDLNLSLRGYTATNATAGLISIGGPTDSNAPQLRGLFADRRQPHFPAVYRVYDWDWSQGSQGGRGAPLSRFDVTLIGMTVEPGEIIHVPGAGYSIGDGMQVLVLYATSERVTIKYTREDNVVDGYTIHIEDICVDPQLQTVYNQMNSAGRRQLLALAAGQPLGRARGQEIKLAIRDKGTFMDPRTAKDWWRGA